MKKYIVLFCLLASSILAVLPPGTTRTPIYLDGTGNGNVINPVVSFSNSVMVLTAPTRTNEVVRFQDLTNAATAFIYPIAINKGGTGTNTAMLPGMVWTNSQTFVVGSNLVVNAGQWASGEMIKLYGQDGVFDFIPRSGLIHSRVGFAFYTNNDATISGWSVSQDPNGAQSHELAISDNINSVNRLHFISNTAINLITLRVTVSSNMTVQGSQTVNVTNSARFYQVNTIPGFTGSITNIGPALGSSNIIVYASGLVTNYFKIP